ncbi:uncharacterized protein LOC110408446 isoform X1 [Numida meleagris]|uniref:uncharacterized protein LOC110408446 isoform X1 n=1 Tax=Numida meleagris TaxID=8996 RepID=UPI000B3E0EF6|nr:uncharacterized protein LOC110408446 isoform X1 [Numida meleagris]
MRTSCLQLRVNPLLGRSPPARLRVLGLSPWDLGSGDALGELPTCPRVVRRHRDWAGGRVKTNLSAKPISCADAKTFIHAVLCEESACGELRPSWQRETVKPCPKKLISYSVITSVLRFRVASVPASADTSCKPLHDLQRGLQGSQGTRIGFTHQDKDCLDALQTKASPGRPPAGSVLSCHARATLQPVSKGHALLPSLTQVKLQPRPK